MMKTMNGNPAPRSLTQNYKLLAVAGAVLLGIVLLFVGVPLSVLFVVAAVGAMMLMHGGHGGHGGGGGGHSGHGGRGHRDHDGRRAGQAPAPSAHEHCQDPGRRESGPGSWTR